MREKGTLRHRLPFGDTCLRYRVHCGESLYMNMRDRGHYILSMESTVGVTICEEWALL